MGTQQMTNPTNPQALLARFATAAEKLRGTGAPGVYEWIAPFEECGDLCDGIACQRYDSYAYNPEAALAGYVMWAMEVAEWALVRKGVGGEVRPYMDHGIQLMFSWRLFDRNGQTVKHDDEWMRDTATISMLESIADAMGGG